MTTVTITEQRVGVSVAESVVTLSVAPVSVSVSVAPGATTFLGLSDTPDAYTGEGTKVVRVNAGATALEFVAAASVGVTDHGALTGLSDDDHTQYHNDARGDLRYWQLSTDLATQAELDAHTALTTTAHGGIVPSARTLTINGTVFDLSANRAWTVGDVRTDSTYANPAWITSLAWSKITGTPTTLAGYGITDAQPLDATLTALAGITTAADKGIYATGVDTFATFDLTSFARTFLDDVDATTVRATLGLTIGTDVQAFDATLSALAAYNTNGLLTQTAADTFTGRTITGTSNRLDVTNGNGVSGNPTLDISSSYVGQATITTLGTIATGTWQGTKIGLAYGGTNADLSATGGTGQYLKQASSGAAITVGTIPYTDLTYSSLTTGQVLRATSASAAAFGALDLANSSAVTGVLAASNGGTGVNNAGTLTNASNTTITGGGTLALAGFTLTVPKTGTAVTGTGGAQFMSLFTDANTIASTGVRWDTTNNVMSINGTLSTDTQLKNNLTSSLTSGVQRLMNATLTLNAASNSTVSAESLHAEVQTSGSANYAVAMQSLFFRTTHASSGTNAGLYGLLGDTRTNAGAGTTTFATSIQAQCTVNATVTTQSMIVAATPVGTGTVTTHYGLYVQQQGRSQTTTSYGIRIDAQSASGTAYALVTGGGPIVLNEDGTDSDVRMEGDTDQNVFFLDASTDRIGVGVATPNNKLEVNGTVQMDGLRVDVTPTAETPAMTHTFTVSLNGTNYKIPVVAA